MNLNDKMYMFLITLYKTQNITIILQLTHIKYSEWINELHQWYCVREAKSDQGNILTC